MNVYFSGLGGVGIGPLVDIAIDAGYSVQGSDSSASPTTEHLAERGVPMMIGAQDGDFLLEAHNQQPIDLFVYTAALPINHPELMMAKQLGIKTEKRYDFLESLITQSNQKLIAVSGTHGKTTTTGMLVWALQNLGEPVSYLIGSSVSFGPAGQFDPASRYFVLECDEYEKHLLAFSPWLSILTSIDYDHPDSYPSVKDYQDTFRQFVQQSERVIIWQKDADYIGVRGDNVQIVNDGDVVSFRLAGEQNRRNATLVQRALLELRIGDRSEQTTVINQFPGTGRRFEKLAENLYSDYGHHPIEIAATLAMARELSDHVVLVYQPHQNRRQHELKNQYIDQFELAEDVYWLPTYLSREDPTQAILGVKELTNRLTNKHALHPAEMNDALWNVLIQARRDGKLVLVMGAGDIDRWTRSRLLDRTV